MNQTRGSTPAEAAYFEVCDVTGEVKDIKTYTDES